MWAEGWRERERETFDALGKDDYVGFVLCDDILQRTSDLGKGYLTGDLGC